jgi:uncharacterized protein
MLPILIASNSPSAGRTFLAVGLAMKLMEMGHSVGFLKPVGDLPVRAGAELCDADALFVKEILSLPEPPEAITPLLMTAENQALLFRDGIKQAQKQVLAALKSVRKRDFVIVCGAGDLLEGSPLGLDSLSLAKAMQAAVLMVEPWRGDVSADALFGAGALLGERFAGGVFNKVPGGMTGRVKDEVKPFLEKKGVPVFGIVPKDQFLEAVTVASLNDILNGTVLCCEDRLDEFVENFLIGAMDVDSALNYFRRTPNKAVITGAHRSDIQLAALETSTKVIILTGGFQTNDTVLDKARSRGIPILSVPDDTFTAIDKIELRRGKTSIREKRKVERAKELIGAGFDMFGFLTKIRMI